MNMASFSLLLIDDDPDIIKLYQKPLEAAGYQFNSASRASDAVEILKTKKFDLILLDLGLPDYNGMSVLQLLKKWQSHSSTPVIILTGNSEISTMVEARQHGIVDYITKPAAIPTLINKVNRQRTLSLKKDLGHEFSIQDNLVHLAFFKPPQSAETVRKWLVEHRASLNKGTTVVVNLSYLPVITGTAQQEVYEICRILRNLDTYYLSGNNYNQLVRIGTVDEQRIFREPQELADKTGIKISL
jgi:DNA-binding response OmpR family regulator